MSLSYQKKRLLVRAIPACWASALTIVMILWTAR